MTQVFFYHGASDKIAAACALIGGAWAKRKPMLVYAPDQAVADSVDRLLWTRDQLSFVPHCRADAPHADETTILIAVKLDKIAQTERLMNLSRDIPAAYQRFQSLIEVVGQDEDERLAARERVRLYKEQGCEVRYFDLNDR
ncbi:DNA polymerase III subunit chi [Azonexus hydrophilus]|uniref:DNA polymerase III subunit chi n=1 Tax=Azonexus hydrophilus TaxID=418702 RepID=A0ABZ2XGJ8_9RHOO|nr:DNA polymerase III subunit chi [Azonexus hydrophilus]